MADTKIQQDREADTRATTSYLRGVAILTIIIGHYALSYQSAFYERYLTEYSMVLALFFVLSGYGIVQSLERRYAAAPGRRVVAGFYFDRGFRIYVPYWLMLVTVSLFPISFSLRRLDLEVLSIYLGAPRIAWFVTAILVCYLLAPLLFRVLRRFGNRGFAVFNLLLLSVSLAASYLFIRGHDWSGNSVMVALTFRQFFLGHIVMFSFGMMLPAVAARYGERLRRSWSLLALSLAALLLSFYLGRFGVRIYPLFLVGTLSFCLMMVVIRPPLPLGRLIILLGTCSYTLYMFHRVFFMLLDEAGLTVDGSRASIVYTLLLSPLLVMFCVFLERLLRLTYARIRQQTAAPFSGGALLPPDAVAADQETS
ncbi:MAG: acyltransferase family protein [Thermoleophilia bacterium]